MANPNPPAGPGRPKGSKNKTHSEEFKTQVAGEIVSRAISYRDASLKYGVSTATLSKWVSAFEAKLPVVPREQVEMTVGEMVNHFLTKTVGMLQTFAEVCSDSSFVRSDPAGAATLAQIVLDRADKFVASRDEK